MNYKLNINILSLLILSLVITIFYQADLYFSLKLDSALIDKNRYLQNMTFFMFLLIVISICILFVSRYFEKKIAISKKLNNKKIKELELINSFYKILQSANGIKKISKVSLKFISEHFEATSATIYIANYKNMKLQLLGAHNYNTKDSPKIIDMYAGVIGEAFSSQKIKRFTNYKITIFAIPLIDNRKTIGVIELKYFTDIKDLKLNDRENTILKIITNRLVKELEDEQNKKYFNLIDKYVLLTSTNTDGEITYASKAFCETSGYDKKSLIGNTHRILKHPDVPNKTFKELWNTIKKGNVWNKEIPNLKKDGTTYWAKTMISPEVDFFGNIIGYNAIREDITDKKLIEQISITDGLTSLYNRRHFDNLFKEKVNLAKRLKKKLAFCILDIDHFKQYNDTYGHQMGDTTLINVASSLQKSLKRESDLIFRLGGEEFGMLFFINDDKDGLFIANNVKKDIEELKIEHEKNSASKYVTVSIGLFICDGCDMDSETIYKITDDNLYKAKQTGRNQVYTNQ